MATYIVIELADGDDQAGIFNVLTQLKKRVTITHDIVQYAEEREQLRRAKEQQKNEKSKPPTPVPVEVIEPPKKKTCPEPPPEEPKQKRKTPSELVPQTDFSAIVPKIEEPDSIFHSLHVPETNWSQPQPTQQVPQFPSLSEMVRSAAASNGQSSSLAKNLNRRQNDAFQCQICGAMIKAYHLDYYKRSNHAIIHTGLQRYICPVPGCGTKTRHRSNMVVHARTVHGLSGKIDVENCLLPHEEAELKQTVINCFPEMGETVMNMQKKEKKRNTMEFENGPMSDEEGDRSYLD